MENKGKSLRIISIICVLTLVVLTILPGCNFIGQTKKNDGAVAPVVEICGQADDLLRLVPYLGLILTYPVDLGGAVCDLGSLVHADELKQKALPCGIGIVKIALSCVKPVDDVPCWLIVLIKKDEGVSDDGDRPLHGRAIR